MNDFDQLGTKFKNVRFIREDLDRNPINQFALWFDQASLIKVEYPSSFILSTASAKGIVSSRVMLLRYFDDKGFVFFSGYGTQKANQIEENPHISMLFSWLKLERQLKVSGTAEKISRRESMKFFVTRSKESQLGAWISQKGEIISSKAVLRARLEGIKGKYREGKIPTPGLWGGYRVRPKKIEFWQGRPNGLHDRFLYTALDDQNWSIERLAP